MTEPTPSHRLQTINDLLLYRLNRLSALAGAMVVRLCEGGHGITRREWGVVGLLCEQGPMAPSALAERFQLDRARTSRMVGSLVDKGLVLREVPPGNRRQALLRATPAGEALYARLMPQVQEINRRVLAALSDAEMAQLDGFIGRLQASADALRQELDTQLPRAQRRLGQRRRGGAGAPG
ncbi:MarR family winged helix-turn-helix transcriptional regulator [Ramlibacter sp. MAHUQ-53]|uniref:MarR family winged helix-turn-helix transcriptional regulator n=1 Tax=unclassified Ramlibacter TaxID=2617605 RepID=UPI003627D0DF